MLGSGMLVYKCYRKLTSGERTEKKYGWVKKDFAKNLLLETVKCNKMLYNRSVTFNSKMVLSSILNAYGIDESEVTGDAGWRKRELHIERINRHLS